MIRRGSHLGRLAAVLLILAGLLAGAAPAVAAPPVSLDDVCAALGVDQVPSDYIVLADVSAALSPATYSLVRDALTSFAGGLAAVDRVIWIPYAETPYAEAPYTETPAAELPAAPAGRYADVRAALAKAVEILAGRTDPATVVLLTAGTHPATGWAAVAGDARRLRQKIDAYAIPLAAATDAELLRRIWPHATVLPPVAAADLGAALARPAAAGRAAKARRVLAGEQSLPIKVSWPEIGISQGRSITTVKLRSPMTYLPLTVDHLSVYSDNPAVTVSVPAGPIDLPPGAQVTVPVTAVWDAGPRSVLPMHTVDGLTTLELSGEVGSPWAGVLRDELGLTLRDTLPAALVDRQLSAQRGSLFYWLAAVVAAAALTEVVLLFRRRCARTAPSGRSG